MNKRNSNCNVSPDTSRDRCRSSHTLMNDNNPSNHDSCLTNSSLQSHPQTLHPTQIRGGVEQSLGPVVFSFGQSGHSVGVPSTRPGPASAASQSQLNTRSSNNPQPPTIWQQTGDATMNPLPSLNAFSVPGIAMHQYGPVQNFTFFNPGSYDINALGHPVRAGGEAFDHIGRTSSFQTQRHGSSEEPMDTVEMRTTFTGTIPPAQPTFRAARF